MYVHITSAVFCNWEKYNSLRKADICQKFSLYTLLHLFHEGCSNTFRWNLNPRTSDGVTSWCLFVEVLGILGFWQKLCLKYSIVFICVCMLSYFSCIWLFSTLWAVAARLLCPWDSPSKSTGVGCRVLLQGIFTTQGSNP